MTRLSLVWLSLLQMRAQTLHIFMARTVLYYDKMQVRHAINITNLEVEVGAFQDTARKCGHQSLTRDCEVIALESLGLIEKLKQRLRDKSSSPNVVPPIVKRRRRVHFDNARRGVVERLRSLEARVAYAIESLNLDD